MKKKKTKKNRWLPLLVSIGTSALFVVVFWLFWLFPVLTENLVDGVGVWGAIALASSSVFFVVAIYRNASTWRLIAQFAGVVLLLPSLSLLQTLYGWRNSGSLGLFIADYFNQYQLLIGFVTLVVALDSSTGIFLRDRIKILKWSGSLLWGPLCRFFKLFTRLLRKRRGSKVSEKLGVEKKRSAPESLIMEKSFQGRPIEGDVPFWYSKKAHVLPIVDLLEKPSSLTRQTKNKHSEQQRKLLLQTLSDFGVKVNNINSQAGPVVTLYKVEPQAGVRSSQIISLSNDLARSMSTISARVAVVQGSNVIGVELPNDERQKVYFRELVEGEKFKKPSIPLALGKDIAGNPVYQDLMTMPHLLIGGSTGSGKSVCMHTIMLSLLYKFQARECGLVLIDPKRLEFTPYAGLPHLVTPVVTEPEKALKSFKWLVKEMEVRYQFMSEIGVRSIISYNATGGVFMPFIVVVIDELADLILVGGKELETCLQRIAQMGRAAGIHLITATQRPSVDVLGGSVKVNFNGRIAFRMASKIDSRTILGESGAEQLLGRGDMLCSLNQKIERYHGAFVSDAEISAVAGFLKKFGVNYPDPVEKFEISKLSNLRGSDSKDEFYDQAVTLVQETDKCSTSSVQRHFKIGYNRAARLVEEMEVNGIITPPNHSGKRTVI